MVRGLYTAYTGMANEQKRLDIISNNLANSATVGYKEENVTSKSFKDFMITKIRDGSEAYVDREIGAMNPGVKIGETYMNWDQGSLRETDNTYDMAIQGNGFFAIKFQVKERIMNQFRRLSRFITEPHPEEPGDLSTAPCTFPNQRSGPPPPSH